VDALEQQQQRRDSPAHAPDKLDVEPGRCQFAPQSGRGEPDEVAGVGMVTKNERHGNDSDRSRLHDPGKLSEQQARIRCMLQYLRADGAVEDRVGERKRLPEIGTHAGPWREGIDANGPATVWAIVVTGAHVDDEPGELTRLKQDPPIERGAARRPKETPEPQPPPPTIPLAARQPRYPCCSRSR